MASVPVRISKFICHATHAPVSCRTMKVARK